METVSFLGEISIVAFGFDPPNWMACEGQVLPISQNSALFSVIGHRFSQSAWPTQFALPDLRGALAIGAGAGPGMANVDLGARLGSDDVTLTADQVPAHSHALQRKGATSVSQKTNVAGYDSNLGQLAALYDPADPTKFDLVPHMTTAAPNTTLSPSAIMSYNGDNRPHENRQPYLAMYYAICVSGAYPTRA